MKKLLTITILITMIFSISFPQTATETIAELDTLKASITDLNNVIKQKDSQINQLQLRLGKEETNSSSLTIQLNKLNNDLKTIIYSTNDREERIFKSTDSAISKISVTIVLFSVVVGIVIPLFAFFNIKNLKDDFEKNFSEVKNDLTKNIIISNDAKKTSEESRNALKNIKLEQNLIKSENKILSISNKSLKERQNGIESELEILKKVQEEITKSANEAKETVNKAEERAKSNAELLDLFSRALNAKTSDDEIRLYTELIDCSEDKNIYKVYAYNNRGIIYAEKGDYDKAIDDYTTAISLDEKYVNAYNGRGIAYAEKGDYDKAIDDYTTAISLDEKYTKAYYNRGIAYKAKGDYNKAIDDYTTAIKLDDKYVYAYNNRGIAYVHKGEYDKAIKDFTKAIELDGKNSDAYNNRGNAYKAKGDYDEAIDDYNKAIELDDKYVNAYNNRGNAYDDKGNFNEAIKNYDKAIELDHKYTLAYNSLSCAYLKLSKKKNIEEFKIENVKTVEDALKLALENIDKAIELDNKDIIYHLNRAEICSAMYQNTPGEQCLENFFESIDNALNIDKNKFIDNFKKDKDFKDSCDYMYKIEKDRFDELLNGYGLKYPEQK